MTSTAKAAKSKSFDPDKKWGLLPAASSSRPSDANGSGGATTTYMFSGHVIKSGPEYLNETFGRGRGEREERKRRQEEEVVLAKLLTKDGRSTGALAVEKARLAMKKDKGKAVDKGAGAEVGSAADPKVEVKRSTAFSAQTMKKLGFDPTAKAGVSERKLDKKRVRDESHPYLADTRSLLTLVVSSRSLWRRCRPRLPRESVLHHDQEGGNPA